MPLYSYSCEDCGTVFEIHGSMHEPRAGSVACQHCGKTAKRDIGADLRGRKKLGDIWPMESDAAAISVDMVPEYRKFDRANGVATEYRDGRPVYRSRGHRRDYFRAHKIFDRDGGYGDAQSPNPRPVNTDDYV